MGTVVGVSEQDAGGEQADAGRAHRDELPAELDAAGFVGPYTFPNSGHFESVLSTSC